MGRAELMRYLEQGMSLEGIGAVCGKHPSTVAYWVEKHGLKAAHRERHLARGGISRDVLSDLVDQGLSVRQIASRVERSATTVRHWLRSYGLRTERAITRGRDTPRPDEVVRHCVRHGKTRFAQRYDGHYSCRKCANHRVSERRRRVKQTLVAEAGGRCAVCGYDRFQGALHFHHVDPALKSFQIGSRGLTRSLASLRAEAKKCVLLCGNCHSEAEAGLISLD